MSVQQRFIEDMKLRGYAPTTQVGYAHFVNQYADHFDKPMDQLTENQLRKFLLYLKEERKLSSSSLIVAYAGLKFLHRVTLRRRWAVLDTMRVKVVQQLPEVLSSQEILRLFKCVQNLKHRAIMMTIYSAGLRVGEACRLKVRDIDSQRMLIRVRGKGDKDRFVMLAEQTLTILREYYRYYRPGVWLFSGYDRTRPISKRTVQRVFQQARTRAGIRKPVSVHSLRHSFATHLMEAGVNLRYIQTAMGHVNIKTTARYTHVCRFDMSRIKSPIDTLEGLTETPPFA